MISVLLNYFHLILMPSMNLLTSFLLSIPLLLWWEIFSTQLLASTGVTVIMLIPFII